MVARVRSHSPLAIRPIALLAALLLASAARVQSPTSPQPTCVRNVTMGGSSASGERATLLLEDGRIEAVLSAEAPTPPGYRIVDAEGLLCLPAFLDAYSRTGCATPEPVKDQDVPVDESQDVGIDMRLANRKGIEPAFRAVEALAIEAKHSKAWREAGFGAALVSPGGQILAGSSSLVVTREAAKRDLVLVADAFAHAAFTATGEGYPSTLMGCVSQLRQFLLDVQRQAELERRYAERRPGARPPFDVDLRTGIELISGARRLLCEAETRTDVERWLALADEFGLSIGILGGREAWRVASELAGRRIPVVLTLDWGKEPKDPAKPEKKSEEKAAPEGEEEAKAPLDEPVTGEPTEPEIVWEYEEPLGIRIERRRLWEEGRDSALALQEAGVSFAFGTKHEEPAKLLEKVRTLVQAGLAPEVALAALTSGAADILGVADRLGRVVPGYDATFTLWSSDPLVDEKAQYRWIFIDGFPTEFPRKTEGALAEPAEGLNVSGAWSLDIEGEGGPTSADLTLEMDKDGSVSGKLLTESPVDKSALEVDVTGKLSGMHLKLEGTLELEAWSATLVLSLTVEADTLTGEAIVRVPGQETPLVQTVSGRRVP